MEEEQSCKFLVDPHLEKEAMAIEAKRQRHDKRIAWRQKHKKRMEEAEKELCDMREQLQKEQELCKQEREA